MSSPPRMRPLGDFPERRVVVGLLAAPAAPAPQAGRSAALSATLTPARRVAMRVEVVGVHVALAVFLCAAGWLALGAAGGDYLLVAVTAPSWARGPLHALGADLGGLGPARFSWLVVAMFGAYLALLCGAARLSAPVVWGAIVAGSALFLLAPSVVSSDVFGYIDYARLGVQHGLNPYLQPPIAAPHDAILPLVYWQHATTPYGPLFTLASYPLGLLSPPAAFWTLKICAAVTSIALAALTSRAAATRGLPPRRAAMLVGLNPVLLIYAVAGAHNDLEAALLVVGGLVLALDHRERGAGALVVAGAAVKVTLGLALPFLIAGARHPRRALGSALGTGAVIFAAGTALFGPHLIDQLWRVASNASFDIRFSGPDLVGRLVGNGITPALRALAVGVIAAIILVGLGRTRRGVDWIAAAGWATVALIASISSFAPWYLVWTLPFAALAGGRALPAAAVTLTAYVLAVHLPLWGGVPWLSPAGA